MAGKKHKKTSCQFVWRVFFFENTAKYGENAFTTKKWGGLGRDGRDWPGRMQEVEYRILMWTLSPEQRKRATGLEKGPWAHPGDEQLMGGLLDKPMSGFLEWYSWIMMWMYSQDWDGNKMRENVSHDVDGQRKVYLHMWLKYLRSYCNYDVGLCLSFFFRLEELAVFIVGNM